MFEGCSLAFEDWIFCSTRIAVARLHLSYESWSPRGQAAKSAVPVWPVKVWLCGGEATFAVYLSSELDGLEDKLWSVHVCSMKKKEKHSANQRVSTVYLPSLTVFHLLIGFIGTGTHLLCCAYLPSKNVDLRRKEASLGRKVLGGSGKNKGDLLAWNQNSFFGSLVNWLVGFSLETESILSI